MKYEVEVTPQGDEFWRYKGKLHRLGGLPAIKYADGGESYWENNKLHRLGGLPAIKWVNGYESYWENGIHITKEEALKRAAPPPPPVPEYTVAQLQAMVGHTFKIVKG